MKLLYEITPLVTGVKNLTYKLYRLEEITLLVNSVKSK